MSELVELMTRIANTAVHAAQEENRRKGIARRTTRSAVKPGFPCAV